MPQLTKSLIFCEIYQVPYPLPVKTQQRGSDFNRNETIYEHPALLPAGMDSGTSQSGICSRVEDSVLRLQREVV